MQRTEIKVWTARKFGGMHNDSRLPFIVEVPSRADADAAFCLNCHARGVDTLSPADRDGYATGAFLCYRCSLNLPNLDSRLEFRIAWPATITAADIEDLWISARQERALFRKVA